MKKKVDKGIHSHSKIPPPTLFGPGAWVVGGELRVKGWGETKRLVLVLAKMRG